MEQERWTIVRNFVIELAIYGGLVFAYFLTILRLLGDWLTSLFNNNLAVYAVVALVLIVVQGVALESLTSLLMRLLGRSGME